MNGAPQNIRFLCVFAIPRTGSSHFNKLLRSCPEIVAKSELFHRHALVQLRPAELVNLSKRSNGEVTSAESFRAWKRQNPAVTLEAIQEIWKRKIIAFKVFSGHLGRELIEEQFLTRDDMAFAILRRRPIESFISSLKAKAGETFTLADTTTMKPRLSVQDFKEWSERVMGWYDWVQTTLESHKRPYAEISFERHFDGKSGDEALALVLEELRKTGLSNIGVPEKVIEGERQDRETDYRARVANWDEFESKMRATPKRSRLLDWAETAR